jgi:hypothetical protein
MRSARALLKLFVCAPALFALACNLDNLGDPPLRGDIYMPTGLMISAQSDGNAPRFMYLINSNFDLRYNRGSVQVYDLDRLDSALSACPTPGVDCDIDTKDILVDEVLVPSLATSVGISPDRRRMYVVTRTDPSMTFIDLDENADGDDVLRCNDSDRRCSDDRRRGNDANDNPRHELLPLEPVGLITLNASDSNIDPNLAPEGTLILIAHRNGQASLFYDDGSSESSSGRYGPRLLDVIDKLPLEPTGIVFDPITRLAYMSLYSRDGIAGESRMLARVGITLQQDPGSDSATALTSSFLYDAGPLVIGGAAPQRDTRAIVMNPTRPGEALVTSVDPAALMFVDVGPTDSGALPSTNVVARRVTDVAAGPTRMTLGKLGARSIVAVSCFDGKALYILDVVTSDILAIVHNLDGPFELQIDEVRRRIYLADFRSSTVRVIDLSYIANNGNIDAEGTPERTDAPLIGTLGIPKVVQELQ